MSNKLVLANAYKAAIIEGGRTFLNSLKMRVYIHTIALSGTVMPAIGSDECTDSGYTGAAPYTNPYPSAFTNVSAQGKAVGITPTVTFSHGSGDFTVYGIYFTDPANSDATVMAQALDTPFLVDAPGRVLLIAALFFFDTMP